VWESNRGGGSRAWGDGCQRLLILSTLRLAGRGHGADRAEGFALLCSGIRRSVSRVERAFRNRISLSLCKELTKRDRSWSLLWTPFAPIAEVTEANREAVAKWLEDRTALLVWLTSVTTGSFVLVTLFGKKLGFETPSQLFLSLGASLLFLSVLLNVICVW